MDTAIANEALHLAMEWGPDWGKPTQGRMKVLHPELTDAELDEYEKIARAAMSAGHGYVYNAPECAQADMSAVVRKTFPWVSDKNISRLHSQGSITR